MEKYLQAELGDVGDRVAKRAEAELFHGGDWGLLLEGDGALGQCDMVHESLFGNVNEQLFPGLVEFKFPQKRFVIRHLWFLVV